MSRFKLNNRFKLAIVLLALVVVFSIGAGLGYAFFFGGISVNLQKGLVGYWDFGAGSTTISTPDRTPNNNDATVTGATISGITDRKGQSGKAYSFDGITNTISVPAASNLNFTSQDFSISTWVYWTTVTSNEAFVWKGGFQARGWYIRTVGTASFDFIVNQVGAVVSQPAQASVIGAGAWYHIVATRTGATVKLYVNGVDKTSTHVDITDPIDNANDALYLGSSITAGFLEGKMDDFRVYNRTLTAAEVLALYESYNPGVVVSDLQKSLVGWWKLDNNTKDSTPYASHLTNNNGVTFTTDRKGQTTKAGQFVRASSQYLSVADSATLSAGDVDFTASGWVYFDSFSTFVNIFGKWNTTGNQREWLLYWDNAIGKFHFAVSSAGTVQQGDVTADSAGTISTGQWYFVVVWHDSVNNNTNIQVNNGTATTTSYSLGVFDSTADFQISGVNGSVNTFDGRTDDVRFYKKVLTASERTALYQSYNPGVVVSDLQKGLVLQLKMDGTAQDATPNNNDGTVTEAALTTDRKSQSSKAYLFDGINDTISIADSTSLRLDDMSIAMWYYIDTPTGGSGSYRELLAKGEYWSANMWALYSTSTDPDSFTFATCVPASGDCSNPSPDVHKSILINTGLTGWVHIVATKSGTTGTIYVNGTSQVSGTLDATTNSASSAVTISGNSRIIKGKEDDVRIYNRALSAPEVKALYESYR